MTLGAWNPEGDRKWPHAEAWLALIACIGVCLVYSRALGFDLLCDDLLVFRPWTWHEWLATWHGTWEAQGAWPVFFRPMAAGFYALAFDVFGINAPALMLMSMGLLILVSWMFGAFVWRETRSRSAAGLALFLYITHPNTPWSSGMWLTNNFHKVAAICAFGALLYWQRVRTRGAISWWPIGLLATLAFLIKEDGLMLIPAVLSLQAARARWIGDVTSPPRVLWIAGAGLAAVLITWRALALGQLGGFALPADFWTAAANLLRGPYYVLTWKASTASAHWMTRIIVSALALAVGARLTWRLPRERQYVVVAGLVMLVWFDAPLALVSNVSRYYMLVPAASLIVAGLLTGLRALTPSKAVREAVVIGSILGASFAMLSSQEALDRMAPCGSSAVECVDWAADIPRLPPEARGWEMTLNRECRAGTERPLRTFTGTMTWGLVGFAEADTSGETYHWSDDRVVALAPARATWIALRLRHPQAAAGHVVAVSIELDGATAAPVSLTSPDWQDVRIPLVSGVRVWLRDAHRLDLRIAAPPGFRPGVQLELKPGFNTK